MSRRAIRDREPAHPASERDLARGLGLDARKPRREVHPSEVAVVVQYARSRGVALSRDAARDLIGLRLTAHAATEYLDRIVDAAERSRP